VKKYLLGTLIAGLLASPLFAEDVVGKVIQIKPVQKGAATDLQYQHKGDKAWFAGYVDMQGRMHDKYKTNANTVAALEFLIGGRVGINKDSEIEIVSERSVSDSKKTAKRVILRKGGMWAKASNLKEPLEIQTNGGVMGIKGTEFVIETQPGGDTSVAVLEGAVEVTDNSGKVIGQAKPGDKYLVPFKGAPVVKNYGSSEEGVQTLRREYEESSGWRSFNEVLNIANTITSFAGYGGAMGNLGNVGYYGSIAGNLAQMDFERNPAQAASALLNVAGAAGVNTGPAGSVISGIGGMFGGGGNRNPEPKKPDFPSELSPDSSPQSKTDKGGAAAPTFRWKGLEGADGYVVLVSQNENFENIEWSARTRETAVVYPSNAKPLDKGKHFWRVLAVNEEDKPMEDKKGAQTFFEVK
jgi:hypothetical protein